MLNAGLLVIRLIFGLTFARHGSEKLLGWFGGHGIKGTAGFFESIGIKPGVPMAYLAAIGEILGGLFLAAGIFLPVAAILIVGPMLVAMLTVTGKNGFAITAGGYEYNLAIIAVAVGILLTGPGAYILF
ncbi:DoxX family protein [Desulfitobacterium metallireducens]|uniref:Oxidoreductase n=1 Tax=Desulfitobacterium metallireducens DSM 15288 TaxID=871968 RepID=W0EA70_9FIRM|nr:DoxX family protein [Desulfitobacterium metallireducens]AHF06124.1 oxidoreductase [Desulfitobacterium metallireducens DSM 15288]